MFFENNGNDNIEKVLRNYENDRLCASMLGRRISVSAGRHLYGHNRICVYKGDFFLKFLTI
jgi:hypothetical protein